MEIQLAASPFHIFIAGAGMFLLGICLTFLAYYRRPPRRFDIWEFAIVPLVVLAVLLWGYWAIDIDPETAIVVMLVAIAAMAIAALPLGPIAWIAMFLLALYALRHGTAALDLVGAACVGLLSGGIAGYLLTIAWRRIPPRPEQ